ncbi:MAG: site-specific integrase, partial [Candidatus Fermentibacteraceae bacterium]|nr:site-specific integrase [Candidatus Fermentibacteraceae bacterium]
MDESVESYIEYAALEKKLASSTVSAYSIDLEQADTWLQINGTGLSQAVTANLAEYIAFLSSTGSSARSVRRKLSSLRGFFRYLQISGLRDDNPAELLRSPKQPILLPHALSLETITSLIEVWSGDSPLSVRNRALLELSYGAGLRESELTGITVGRILLEEALVRPIGKGSKERIVPIGGPAVRWISTYIDTARPLLAHGRSTAV